jgi:proline iminopeptidase
VFINREDTMSPLAKLTLISFATLTTITCGGEDPAAPPPAVPRTVDHDPKLAAVDLAGTRVHVKTMGNPHGRVLIVLHGGPGDDFVYMLPLAGRAAGKSLTDDHLLVFWDQRSSGLSRRHDPRAITLDNYLQDLDDVISHYSPGAPVGLIGHSWGGTYATAYLNEKPERVYGAALIEPGGLSTALRNHDQIEGQRALFDMLFADLFVGDNVSEANHDQADRILADFFGQLPREEQVPFARFGTLVKRELELQALEQPFDFTTRLDRVGFEVLFVAGDTGDLGVTKQELQRKAFPQSRLVAVSGAAHNDLTGARAADVIPSLVEYFAARER